MGQEYCLNIFYQYYTELIDGFNQTHTLALQVVLPLIALSAVGWLVYVVGFGLFNDQ